MPKQTTDYESYLRERDGAVWLLKEDALRLGAGFLPVYNDRTLSTELLAPNEQAELNLRTLLGAFNDDRLTIERPRTQFVEQPGSFDGDGFTYVEAVGFLNWLGQYITQTQAKEIAITFPSELARAVKKAKARAQAAHPSANSETFDSLTIALDGQFDKPLEELPEALRQLVERDSTLHSLWDGLAPEQRQWRAAQWDDRNDPVTKPERDRLRDLHSRLVEMEATDPKDIPSEVLLRKDEIKKLQYEIDRIEKGPVTTHPPADVPTAAPPAPGRQDADQQPALRRGDKVYRGGNEITGAYNRHAGTNIKWPAIRLKREQGLNIVYEPHGQKEVPTLDHIDLLDFLDHLPR